MSNLECMLIFINLCSVRFQEGNGYVHRAILREDETFGHSFLGAWALNVTVF